MWKVKYLIHYKDMNRWGESKAYGRRSAFQWVTMAGNAILEIHVYMSEKCIASFKRDERGKLERIYL